MPWDKLIRKAKAKDRHAAIDLSFFRDMDVKLVPDTRFGLRFQYSNIFEPQWNEQLYKDYMLYCFKEYPWLKELMQCLG